MRRNSKL